MQFVQKIVEFGRNKLSKVIKIPELSRKIVKSVRKIGGGSGSLSELKYRESKNEIVTHSTYLNEFS